MIKINIGRKYIYEFIIEDKYDTFGIILEKDKDFFHIKYYGYGNSIKSLKFCSYEEYVRKERINGFSLISSNYYDALKIVMHDEAIKYIEENIPKPTEAEKEKKRGLLSIFKHNDKQGALSIT